MAVDNLSIWDVAKQDALSRAKKVTKKKKHVSRDSALKTPISIMKVIVFLTVIYALAQYLPAFVNVKKIITQTTAQSGAQTMVETRKKWGPAAPLRKYIKLNKAYMRAGQSLQVKYILPEDAAANLTIKQCKPAPFIEAFRCDIISTENIEIINDTVGTRRFIFKNTAMYLLESDVKLQTDGDFDITWQRN